MDSEGLLLPTFSLAFALSVIVLDIDYWERFEVATPGFVVVFWGGYVISMTP